MRINFLIFFLLLSVAAVIVGFSSQTDSPPARAHQGVLDLRDRDFERQPSVNLDGDWDFYWRRFLDPDVFLNDAKPVSDGVQEVPGSWYGRQLGEETVDGKGFATLHLRILTRPSQSPLALRLVGFYPANRVWINGQLISETGRIAQRAEDEVMNHSLQIAALPDNARVIDVVLHVSNFHMRQSGKASIQMGRLTDLQTYQVQKSGLAMLSIGTLLLMGFYHIVLYLLRRKNLSPLYLGLNCLFWTVFIASNESSEWIIHEFFPAAAGETLFRVWPVCMFMASALAFQFYRSLYPREFPRWLVQVLWGISLVYVVLAIVAPIPILTAAMPGYYLVTIARMVFSAWALFMAARRKRTGALIILDGYLLMLALAVNDMLYAMDLIHSVLTLHLGMIIFMFAQSIALAQRFSALFASVEQLSTELVENNLALNEEIAERTRLQHEIVSVSEQERRRISHVLHDGLCQQLTGARLQCSGLASLCPEGGAGEKELDKLARLLDETVDQAHELAHGLWPMELEFEDVYEALATLVQRQRAVSGIPIDFVREGDFFACAGINAAQIYGIAREAISNAVKHARPSRITVTLKRSDTGMAKLTVSDDGIGRSAAQKSKGGLGLRIMAYRAQMIGGELSIEDRKGGGTRVVCSLPCGSAQNPKVSDRAVLQLSS